MDVWSDDRVPARRPPLWLTIRGASPWVPLAWVAWMGAVALAASGAGAVVGGGGLVVGALTLGWLIARRIPSPAAAWCRYHVDDAEVTAMGPGRRVRRLAWSECRGYLAAARGLRLHGGGEVITVPIPDTHAPALWRAVLAGLVPGRAEALWRAHEHGAVRLVPAIEPDASALVCWAWLPAATVAVLAPGIGATSLVIALSALQCLIARARAEWRSVVLQPSGVVGPGGGRRSFVAWDEMDPRLAEQGLEVRGPRGTVLVAADVPDFLAAVAVIRLRASIGFVDPDDVSFRVASDEDGLAVVGEVAGG